MHALYSYSFFFLSPALLHNHLTFGDLPVGTSRQISFTIVNHSPSLVYRFETPALEGLSFLPSVGHLHPRASKEVTVTLNSERKLVLKRSKIEMTLMTIAFTQPLSQVHWCLPTYIQMCIHCGDVHMYITHWYIRTYISYSSYTYTFCTYLHMYVRTNVYIYKL